MKKVWPSALAAGFVMTVGSEAYAHAGEEVVAEAKRYLGTPYRYGSAVGNTSSFDCSSFTSFIFKQHGVNLPRTSRAQAKVGKPVRSGELQPGDLVFFDTDFDGRINHVAIYAGNGKMIGAQSSGVGYANPFSPYYWSSRYVTARRILSDAVKVDAPKLKVVNGGGQSATESNDNVTVKSVKFHTVRKGDTLWDISRKYKTSVQTLKNLNDFKSHWIYPGQTILLPDGKTSQKDVVVRGYKIYTVQKGNTLWGIGKKYGVSVDKLMKTNKLNSSLIYPGQQIVLPK